ncbi:MAG: TetR/AcrR family transcriptional regulator [Pseudomonadota bacterium]
MTSDTPNDNSAALSEAILLDCCISVFLENGYGNTTLADIAAKTNVDVATLEERYGTKEALFRLAVDREATVARQPLPGSVPTFNTALEAIQFAMERRKYVMQNTVLADICRVIALESEQYPEIADIFRTNDGREQMQAVGELTLSAWIEQGLFRPCNVSFAVRQLYGLINQAFLFEPRTIGHEIDDLDAYLQDCCEWFVERYGAPAKSL